MAADSPRADRRGSAVPTPPGPTSSDAHEPLVPITLELSPIRRLLIIDVADDPSHRTLEPQVLAGADGDAVVLLAYRHDGHVELYAPSGLDVDLSGYDGLGKGLLGIHETASEHARFEVADDGLQLDLALVGPNGRGFDLHLHEYLAGPRDRFPVLAPVGGAFDAPTSFPFLWLPGMPFVPVPGTHVVVRVDGQRRRVPRLPLPVGGRRYLMARYDPDVLVCQLNPDSVDVPPRAPGTLRAQPRRRPHQPRHRRVRAMADTTPPSVPRPAVGVVARGDQQLRGALHADAGLGEQRRGGLLDQPGDVGVELGDLLDELEVGKPLERELGGRLHGGHDRARTQCGGLADLGQPGHPGERRTQLFWGGDDQGVQLVDRGDLGAHGRSAGHPQHPDHLHVAGRRLRDASRLPREHRTGGRLGIGQTRV
jgi:hypothetical protein